MPVGATRSPQVLRAPGASFRPAGHGAAANESRRRGGAAGVGPRQSSLRPPGELCLATSEPGSPAVISRCDLAAVRPRRQARPAGCLSRGATCRDGRGGQAGARARHCRGGKRVREQGGRGSDDRLFRGLARVSRGMIDRGHRGGQHAGGDIFPWDRGGSPLSGVLHCSHTAPRHDAYGVRGDGERPPTTSSLNVVPSMSGWPVRSSARALLPRPRSGPISRRSVRWSSDPVPSAPQVAASCWRQLAVSFGRAPGPAALPRFVPVYRQRPDDRDIQHDDQH